MSEYQDITIEFEKRTSEDAGNEEEIKDKYGYWINVSTPWIPEPVRRIISLKPVLTFMEEANYFVATSQEGAQKPKKRGEFTDDENRKELCAQFKTNEELGRKLYDCIWEDRELYGILERTKDRVTNGGGRIRIKIEADLEAYPEIGCLPWEVTFDPSKYQGGYLTTKLKTSFIRYVPVNELVHPNVLAENPEVLLVIANAEKGKKLDTASERNGLLDQLKGFASKVTILDSSVTKEEEEKIKKEFDEAGGEVEIYRDSGKNTLRELLKEDLIPVDIFHFIGHAKFGDENGKGLGQLLLEDMETPGASEPLSSNHLTTWFKRTVNENGWPQLIFLNGCNTGNYNTYKGDSPFTGLATSLVKKGFPAILAMQRKVEDEDAILFAKSFYKKLKKTKNLVDSTHKARLDMRDKDKLLEENPGSEENLSTGENSWAIPVLYLRTYHPATTETP